jgi:hypothetical protein
MNSRAIFAALWFAAFRLAWAVYWFSRPQMATLAFRAKGGGLPIVLSTLAAAWVGWRYGRLILDPARTRSGGKAALWGILFEHLTTLVYLPAAALILSLQTGMPSTFPGRLILSLITSLAGLPIHTLLGAVNGTSLYVYCQLRKAPSAPVA